MRNTSSVGDGAEIAVLSFLHAHGYTVSKPFGHSQPYDLIAESPLGNVYRVQVCACQPTSGVLKVKLRRYNNGKSHLLDFARIEILALWDGGSVYLMSKSEIGMFTGGLHLRLDTPRNNQVKGIRNASSYRNALGSMP